MSEPVSRPGTLALTGGSGFVGGHVLRALVRGGWRVRALTRRPDGLPQVESDRGGAVTAVQGDLDSPEALADLVSGAEAVIHCAGLVAARRRQDFARVNAEGTARLLDAVHAEKTVKRFILVSSLAAREPGISPYAQSKHQAETLLRRDAAGLDWQILRPPVVYGPGDRATLPLFRQFARGLAFCPAGAGRFSMLFVEDLATVAVGLLAGVPPAGRVLEVDDGTPGGYGWPEVLAAAERQLGRRVRALPVPRPVQRLAAACATLGGTLTGRPSMLTQGKVNEVAHPDWVCRPADLGDCLSGRARVGLDEGFSRTLAWYKAAGWL